MRMEVTMKNTGILQDISVKGHIEDRRGIWHMFFWTKDRLGNTRRFSKSTGLPVRANKKKAEDMLKVRIKELKEEMKAKGGPEDRVLFADYLVKHWLPTIEKTVQITTFSGYCDNVEGVIAPYFREKGLFLQDVEKEHIKEFYEAQLALGKKAKTIHRYHANLRKAIALAVEENLISTFFMADVKRPAISEDEIFEPKFLSESEAIAIVNAAKSHPLELTVIIGVYYGLRRGEICGLRWSAISFDTNTITVNHTIAVARVRKKGKNDPGYDVQPRHKVVFSRNRGKSKKSLRSLPLVPELRTMLLEVKKRQEYYRELCGNCYNNEFADYIYTDEMGKRNNPDYITRTFPRFLERNGFSRIRFHDLRHTSGSLLVAKGVPMKLVQEWLGHSDFNLTANVYAHLDKSVTALAAEKLEWIQKTNLSGDRNPTTEDASLGDLAKLLQGEGANPTDGSVQIPKEMADMMLGFLQTAMKNHQPMI